MCDHPRDMIAPIKDKEPLHCRACGQNVMFFTIPAAPLPETSPLCKKCRGEGGGTLTTTDGRPVRYGCEDCHRTGINLDLIDKHKQAVIALLESLERKDP